MAITHLTFDFRTRHKRRYRIDYQHVDADTERDHAAYIRLQLDRLDAPDSP